MTDAKHSKAIVAFEKHIGHFPNAEELVAYVALAETIKAENLDDKAENKFNPSQPRDKDGKWSDGGGASRLLYNNTLPDYGTKAPDGYTILYTNTKEKSIDSILKNGLKTGQKQVGYGASPEEGDVIWTDTRSPKSTAFGGNTIAFKVKTSLADSSKVNDTQHAIPSDVKPKDILFVDRVIQPNSGVKVSNLPEYVSKYGKEKTADVIGKTGTISREDTLQLIEMYEARGKNSLNNKTENYSPSQPRDADGKWTDGGGGGSSSDSVKPYKGNKSDSATKYIKDNYGDVTYSDDELRVINNYTGSMFARMNRTLRGKDATRPITETAERAKQTQDHISVMDKAIAKTKLKTDQTLWRAATSAKEITVGQVIPDKGYGSTSMREEVADVFLGQNMVSSKKPVQYIMKINAKKGQTGIFAQNAMNNSYENEFILPHGVDYKVTKVTKTDGFYEIEADLL